MVKVRFDIVVFTIVWTFLLILVTYFIPPYERELFKELDLIGGYNGYPATEYVDEVTTLAEIEAAAENYDEFAIKVDSDNVKATNYFASATNSDSNTNFFKSNSFLIHAQSLLNKKNYDRLYIVELADGNQVVVQMYSRVLDLSEDTIVLPIAEYKSYTKSIEALEALDEKYDFAYSNPTSSLMNASGHSFCYVSEVSDKRDSMYNLTWAIIAGGMVLYTIASTVAILNAKRKARKNQ